MPLRVQQHCAQRSRQLGIQSERQEVFSGEVLPRATDAEDSVLRFLLFPWCLPNPLDQLIEAKCAANVTIHSAGHLGSLKSFETKSSPEHLFEIPASIASVPTASSKASSPCQDIDPLAYCLLRSHGVEETLQGEILCQSANLWHKMRKKKKTGEANHFRFCSVLFSGKPEICDEAKKQEKQEQIRGRYSRWQTKPQG